MDILNIIDKKIKQAEKKGNMKLVQILKQRKKQLLKDETITK